MSDSLQRALERIGGSAAATAAIAGMAVTTPLKRQIQAKIEKEEVILGLRTLLGSDVSHEEIRRAVGAYGPETVKEFVCATGELPQSDAEVIQVKLYGRLLNESEMRS